MDKQPPYWGGFNSENLGFWVRDGIYTNLFALLMRRLEPQEFEYINQGHTVLAKVTVPQWAEVLGCVPISYVYCAE